MNTTAFTNVIEGHNIYKKLGRFVDKNYRVQAGPDTCFTKRTSPCPILITQIIMILTVEWMNSCPLAFIKS